MSDLTPLQQMNLTKLVIDRTQVRDLTPLQGMHLSEVHLTPRNITNGMDVLRHMKSFKTIVIGSRAEGSFPATEFWQKYDAKEFK